MSYLMRIFAMTKRRERAKAQGQLAANVQLAQAGKKTKERREHVVELGKFFIDLAKLVFGGVVLTILLDYESYKLPLFYTGIVVLVLFVELGYQLIKYGNR